MEKIRFFDKDGIADELFRFAVIVARSEGKWVYVRHRERDTYEIPGGHREAGESIDETARRELYEETGAVGFTLTPVCAYAIDNFGMLYYAEINEFEPELHFEIAEVIVSDELPQSWTYPTAHPHIVAEVVRRGYV